MKDLSPYQILIKYEQQKVRDVAGCAGRCVPDTTARDDLELIQDMFDREDRNNINTFTAPDDRLRYRSERRNRRRAQRTYTDTNVYEFENQGLVSNAIGDSNRLTERSIGADRKTIDEILNKYRRRR